MVKIQIILLWIKLARFVSNIEKWDFLSDFQTLWWSIPAKHSIAAGVRQASTSHGSHSRTFGACGRRWFWASEKWENKQTKKIIAIFSIFSADAVFIFLTSGLWQTRFWARQNVFICGTTETWAGAVKMWVLCITPQTDESIKNCWKVAWFVLKALRFWPWDKISHGTITLKNVVVVGDLMTL